MRYLLPAACALLLAAPAAAAPPPPGRPTVVRVHVLNFDPIIDPALKTRLHQECKWNDPRKLAEQYAADVKQASGGLVTFQIVGWQDLDEFPVKADGFAYTAKGYMEHHRTNKGWHQPDLTDYPKVIAKYKLAEKIEKGECDEFWWFGGPYFGFGESAMAGRGAFYINGPVYGPDKVPCKKAFAVMGFNYERGPAEMIHNLCHRAESTMSRVFGGWQADKLDTDWARFAANAKQSNGAAAVGTCHYPPNGQSDYDYANRAFVDSTADDWLNYPNLTGAKTKVNRDTWGGPDYQRNYLRWWFARFPRAAGANKESGRQNNWWEYLFRFNEYDDRGRPVVAPDPKRERAAAEAVLAAGGRLTVLGDRGAVPVERASDLPAGAFEVTDVALVGRPGAAAALPALAGLPRLRLLNLGGSPVAAADVQKLGALPALEWLSLSGTKVTDAGLAAVGKFPRLIYLELNGTAVGDAGLAALAGHPALAELHVNNPAVTDAAVKSLVGVPKLARLSLADTKLTDAGLAQLAQVKGLVVLWLNRTKVSDAAVARFKAAVPAATVNR